MSAINWGKNIQMASSEVSRGTRLLLLFFSGGKECEGSERMMEETLKDDKVVQLIERESVPLLFNIRENGEFAKKYHVDWTPTFILADENGMELERTVGYLPPRDFMAQMTLAKGLAAFHLERFEEAEREFAMVIEEFADSELVPQAEYYLGATRFKVKGDSYPLGEVCHTLMSKYPESLWTKRCSVWSHVYNEARKPFVAYDQGGSAGSGAY